MFLSFLSFKNPKPDLSKLGSETYTRKMKASLFHNRICKVCTLVAATLILPSLAYAQNNQGNGPGINPSVPNGTYSLTENGWVPATNPGQVPVVDGQVPFAGAGRITYIPTGTINGQVTGKTSGVLTASINGQIFPITVKGFFTVNPDGSVSGIEKQTGGPNALLHFTGYPTPDGNTITFVLTDPGSIACGIDTR